MKYKYRFHWSLKPIIRVKMIQVEEVDINGVHMGWTEFPEDWLKKHGVYRSKDWIQEWKDKLP